METLLDQADALIKAADPDDGPERPSFDIPESLLPLTTPNGDVLEIRENPSKGRGWFAKQPIPAGTVLFVAKPIAMALDMEYVGPDQNNDEDADEEFMEEYENQEEQGSTVNELLVLEVLQSIFSNPSIWTEQVSLLYPRDSVDIEASPVWISRDDSIFGQYEALIEQLETVPALQGKSKEISQRLPLIIRYNVLSIETCPELLSHPGPNGHAPLSGVGLYHWPSFFNHDGRPNVSRYLEHDILCESPQRRNLMLRMDFKEDDEGVLKGGALPGPSAESDGPDAPVVDDDVQNELMGMNTFERLEAIDQLMQQAAGEALPEGEGEDLQGNEDDMEAHGEAWFECDLQNLRILKAITLEAMGLSDKALSIWEECVRFTETQMPPNDETSIVMRVQAALCSLHLKQETVARHHASVALQRHHLIFGGGVGRFRRRYRQEFLLNLRPADSTTTSSGVNGGVSMEEFLWPHVDY
ncbi:SET methyltransferase domain containing protein [Nitzschia inconspicua]|uniref:SET methyltransferase domain containing protein n=1 Tax=Nitzschia inconspicua TaxID=303405 RepID=A0A9K3PXT6_9STRA|nr:SET methyltransferase domain containing protein [Nitzschia inconspicua]